MEGSLRAKNQLDSSSHFDTISACDVIDGETRDDGIHRASIASRSKEHIEKIQHWKLRSLYSRSSRSLYLKFSKQKNCITALFTSSFKSMSAILYIFGFCYTTVDHSSICWDFVAYSGCELSPMILTFNMT